MVLTYFGFALLLANDCLIVIYDVNLHQELAIVGVAEPIGCAWAYCKIFLASAVKPLPASASAGRLLPLSALCLYSGLCYCVMDQVYLLSIYEMHPHLSFPFDLFDLIIWKFPYWLSSYFWFWLGKVDFNVAISLFC